MKIFIFKRESNDFSDILKDTVIKNKYKTKLFWQEHMLIGSHVSTSELESYIILKYGDDLLTQGLIKDFSPIPYVDYMPSRDRPEKYKNVYK